MQAKIEEALLKIYFPQIRPFNFKYNWNGKIKAIFFNCEVLPTIEYE